MLTINDKAISADDSCFYFSKFEGSLESIALVAFSGLKKELFWRHRVDRGL